MSVLPQAVRRFILCALVLCLLLPAGAVADHMEEDVHTETKEDRFSVLILGDSQMAGAGWEKGFANCICETYPHAEVLNIAQNGSRLLKGEIQQQWQEYLSLEYPLPDYILMDGGANDLLSLDKDAIDGEDIAIIRDELEAFLEQIHKDSPDTEIIYVSMPPLQEWSNSDKGPPTYKTQCFFWKKLNAVAARYYYVTVLDLFSLNPFHFPCKECYEAHFADSLHLNENGYRKVFNYYIDNMFIARWAE